MDEAAVRNVMAGVRDCAGAMLDRTTYIQKGLARVAENLNVTSFRRRFMKLPICAVCGQRITGEPALVKFADYEPLPEDIVGHPQGVEWFCDEHYGAAEELCELPLHAALERLKEQFS